jgi:hypothetical protein
MKEEVMPALVRHVDQFGGTHQQVASIGAWFYMCLPAELARPVAKAFYEWCKSGYKEAVMPAEIPPLAARVMKAINAECAKEAAAREEEDRRLGLDSDITTAPDPLKAATPAAAAEQALAEAADTLQDRRRPSRRASATGRDKARKSG